MNSKMPNLPEIRIKYAWLLTQNTWRPMMDYYDKGGKLRSEDEYETIAKQYQKWWRPYEKQILQAMYDVLKLEFKPNVIDVHVAPFFYAFSSPLVLGVQFDTQEKLILNLTHELLHKLFMDNTTHDDQKNLDEWTELFGEHEFVTLVHIPVHAMLHKIFIDIIERPDMLNEEVRTSKTYRDSWNYVEKNGYKKLVEKLQKQYQS
jgi:hypothetical protein